MIYFIKPSEVITRIKDTVALGEANLSLPDGFSSYANRVAGSGMIDELTEETIQNLPTPSCFVLLSDGSVNTKNITTVDQDIFHGYDIAVVLDTKDSRKQTVEEQVVSFKDLLIYCLNGWKPIGYDSASPLRFVGDSTVFTDRSKYVRVFTFIQDTRFITSQDGLGDIPEDFDLQNLESIITDLFITESGTYGDSTPVHSKGLYTISNSFAFDFTAFDVVPFA